VFVQQLEMLESLRAHAHTHACTHTVEANVLGRGPCNSFRVSLVTG
jgi:hypothetical protein